MRPLVRFDGLAALSSGCFVLLLRDWISGWSGLSVDVLGPMAAVSLVYAAYSLSLSLRPTPLGVKVLIGGNVFWALVCVGVVVRFRPTALGAAYLLGEALFVAALAWFEYRQLRATPGPL